MSKTNPIARLLIVDDEIELMNALCESLTGSGYDCVGIAQPKEALALLQSQQFDLMLTDLMMPEMDGIELLRRALEIDPVLVAILMTGQGTIQTAVEAIRTGAFDYILKPFKLQAILPVLQRALEVRRLKHENSKLHRYVEQLEFESKRYEMVGSSPAMQKIFSMIEKVAGTDVTVLVRGPSGAGKELVARAIHRNSARKDQPLVTINCAALQETLLESELFGYEKGAFTGAVQAKAGLFEVAENGTLFIDEVAEMSPGMQAKFLRVLENGSYRRVGGTSEREANVRIIAATNKPLEEEQKAGRFREDLFYRLNVISINLPALRDHVQDIPELVDHLLATRQIGRHRCQIDTNALQALMAYDWPGNIRELVNVLERAQILADGNRITIRDLPDAISQRPEQALDSRIPASSKITTVPEAVNPAVASPDATIENLEEIEKQHIVKILQRYRGNKVQAAKALGISRRTLYRFLDRYGMDTPRGEEDHQLS